MSKRKIWRYIIRRWPERYTHKATERIFAYTYHRK